MPLPITFDRATLTINGASYQLRNVSARSDFSQEFDPAMGMRGPVGRTVGRTQERVTIEAEVLDSPELESDADLRARMRQMWESPFTVETATGRDLDLLAETYSVRRERATELKTVELLKPVRDPSTAPKPKSVWDRLLGDETLC